MKSAAMTGLFPALIAAMTLAITLAPGCGPDPESEDLGDAIRIGALFSVTGPASPLGTAERDAAQMVAEQLNAAGGINGRKIDLIIYDTEGKEDKALQLVKRLIERDRVTAIIGGSLSGTTLAIIPEIERHGIPYISCAASIEIVEPIKKWVFKTPASDQSMIIKILEHIKAERPDVKRIGMINADNPFGASGLNQLKRLAPKHGFELVTEKTFNNEQDTATQLGPVLLEMARSGAQAIICWGTHPGPAHITAAWQDTGIKARGIPLYQSQGVANRRYIDFAENLSTGSTDGVMLPTARLLVADQLPDSDPQKQLLLKFSADFRKRFNREADIFGGHAWDAFMLMANAMEQAGEDKAKIRDAIENTRGFVGIDGVFNFSPTDHNGLSISDFVMVAIQDRKWILANE